MSLYTNKQRWKRVLLGVAGLIVVATLGYSNHIAERIRQEEKRKVGWLAGGWNIAANRLGAGAKVPAFVRRHGAAPGQVIVDFRADRLRIVLENQVKYADYVGGLQKRASFALRKRVHAMQRQIPYLIRKASVYL